MSEANTIYVLTVHTHIYIYIFHRNKYTMATVTLRSIIFFSVRSNPHYVSIVSSTYGSHMIQDSSTVFLFPISTNFRVLFVFMLYPFISDV